MRRDTFILLIVSAASVAVVPFEAAMASDVQLILAGGGCGALSAAKSSDTCNNIR